MYFSLLSIYIPKVFINLNKTIMGYDLNLINHYITTVYKKTVHKRYAKI